MRKLDNYKLELGTIWLDCILIYSNKKLIEPSDIEPDLYSKIEKEYKKYTEINGDSLKYKIWYDIKNNKCFSQVQYKVQKGNYISYGLAGKEHSFVCSSEDFINSRFGAYTMKAAVDQNEAFGKQKIFFNNEFTNSSPEFLKKYNHKDILIVAAGPSTKSVKWENIKCDYIFSCNKFFNNKSFDNRVANLIYLAPDQDLNNENIHEYIKKYDSDVCFEADRTGFDDVNKLPIGTGIKKMHEFVDMHPDKCCLFNLRYQGAIGMGSRMILNAIFLGAKNIYFVGFDGNTVNGPMHSFEKEKVAPSWCQREDSRAIQKRLYIIFWEYVLQLKQSGYDFNLYNLGEGTEHNVSSDISKKCCPLPDDIKEVIKK